MPALALPNFDKVITTTNAEARCYQREIVNEAVKNALDIGVRSQLVNSPTGSGKTVIGLGICRMLQEHNPKIGVGWCAMRQNLLAQVVNANDNLNMGVNGLTPISMFQSEIPSHDSFGRPYKLLVVDEAQHDAAASMGRIHNTLRPDYVIGLSATPYRTDKLKLCFEKVLRNAGIHQLIEMGYLARYHHCVIPEWTVNTVVERYLAEPERWGKSAIYWLNEGLASDCLDRLRAAGVRAEIVIGSQSFSEREEILARFDGSVFGDGDPDGLDVLVNMFVLTEGWDCTSLKTVWVRDSQRGPTVQMAGRVFRIHPEHEFKQVVQSKLTHYPMSRHATPSESYVWMDEVDNGWRSVKPSKVVAQVSTRAMMTLAHTKTSMPDFITKNRGLQRRDNAGGIAGGGAFIH
jgi:superfamily II DNA or RNA helicase